MTDETGGPWETASTGDGWLRADNEHGDCVMVRFALNERGRFEPTELRLEPTRPIDSTMLRRVPLTMLEGLANTFMRDSLINSTRAPSPPPPRFTFSFRKNWLADAPAGAKPDRFYQQLAGIYSWLALRSNRPAAELAEANEIPITTVHRWVKEARRRGFLPPGQKGRRG